VRVANGPFDAGMIADQFRPHVIFVDIMIEDLNARAICKTLRDNPDLCDMRVVAITSELTDGEGHAVLQQGFDAWVPRPLELRTLIRCIEETSSIVH
jgi:DNA-binding response OmpR family regulator